MINTELRASLKFYEDGANPADPSLLAEIRKAMESNVRGMMNLGKTFSIKHP
jgi:hypothetical protein